MPLPLQAPPAHITNMATVRPQGPQRMPSCHCDTEHTMEKSPDSGTSPSSPLHHPLMNRRSFLKLTTTTPLAGAAHAKPLNRQPVALDAGAQWHQFIAGEDVDFSVVQFSSSRCELRVIDQPERSSARDLGTVMQGTTAVAGINAGFFTPEFTPLGLVISGGRRTGEWMRSTLLGGAVMVRNGKLLLLWRDEVGGSQGVTQLVQAGPRLVNHGAPVAGLEANKQRARSFIATDGDGRWIIGTAAYTSLAELAHLLSQKDFLPGFSVHRALNFDGGKSTGFWVRKPDGTAHYDREFATVRNFVGIFPRN